MLRHILLTILLMSSAILVVGQLYLTIPLTEEIAAVFSAEFATAAWAASAFGFAYAIGFLIWGPLSDRLGRLQILVGGLLAMTVVTGLLGFADNLAMFLAGRAAQGFVASSFPPVALSLVSEVLPSRRRALGVSLISFAFLAAAPLAQFVAVGLSMTPTAFMLGVSPFYLILAVGLFLALPAHSSGSSVAAQANSGKGQSDGLFGNPLIVAGWGAALTVLFGFVIFQAGTAMGIGGGFDPQVVRLVGLPPLALCLLAAPISHRIGAPATARAGLLLCAAGLALSGFGSALTLLGAVLVSGGVGLAVPGLIITLSSAASDANRGLTLSLYTFTLFVGASIASPVATVLASSGPVLVYGVPALLLVIGAAGLTLALSRVTRRSVGIT
ncbi:MAG: MFS transporter [Marinobacter sp.]